MKVAFDFQTFLDQQYGGVSRYFVELYKGFKGYADCKVSIPLAISKNEYLEECGVKRCIPNNKLFFNRYTKKLYYLINIFFFKSDIRKNEYDIIHLTWNDPYLKCDGCKIVATVHDMIHELIFDKEADVNTKMEIENKKRIIYESDAIIAISDHTKKDILTVYPDVPEEKIRVIHHGANILPDAEDKLHFELPERYMLYVGNRGLYKNANSMVEALSDLVKEEKNLYIFFAGGGEFTKNEEELYSRLGIRNRIIQKRVTDSELAYLYRNAICFIFPSLYEGFGAPILEAFAKDCPVICTNRSSFPEIGGDAAAYYDPDDDCALSDVVREVLYDDERRDELIRRGRERVKLFTYDLTCEKTYDLYRSLIYKS